MEREGAMARDGRCDYLCVPRRQAMEQMGYFKVTEFCS